MTYINQIQKIETYDKTNVYAFKGVSSFISIGKDEEPYLEIFDLVDVKNITLHKKGFTLSTNSKRAFKYYYPENKPGRENVVRQLAGLVDQRFNAGLQVFKQYPNITIEKPIK